MVVEGLVLEVDGDGGGGGCDCCACCGGSGGGGDQNIMAPAAAAAAVAAAELVVASYTVTGVCAVELTARMRSVRTTDVHVHCHLG
eukprot:2288079-Pleurochrysis_carterae.AAC.1